MLNNSEGARISISYSIFDAATACRLVSFPLCLCGQQKPSNTESQARGTASAVSLFLLLQGQPRPSPLFILPLSAIVLAYHLTWGQVTLPHAGVRARLHFKAPSDLQANWLRYKPSQQGHDFEVAGLCRAWNILVCVSHAHRPACC